MQDVGKYLTSRNAYKCEVAALRELAGGVQGAPETVLARVAATMSSNSNDWGDTRTMGYVFLDSIVKNAQDSDKRVIAQAARTASGQYLTDVDGARIPEKAFQDLQA